jgi:hypothetical protein
VIVGFAVPITWASDAQAGVFVYFSYEGPFTRK